MRRSGWYWLGLCVVGAVACSGKVQVESESDPPVVTHGGAGNVAGSAPLSGGAPARGGASAMGGGSTVGGAPTIGGAGSAGASPGTAGSAGDAGASGSAASFVASVGAGCGSVRLALSSSALYYTASSLGTVSRIALAGFAQMPLAVNQAEPTLLLVRADSLFWLSAGDNAIHRDGGPTPLVVPALPIHGFTVDGANKSLYYSTGTSIYGLALGTSSSLELAIEERGGAPQGLAMEGSSLAYPTEINGDVDVVQLGPGGPALCSPNVSSPESKCIRLARSEGLLDLEHVAFDDGRVYWVVGNQVRSASPSDPSPIVRAVAYANEDALSITAFSIANGSVYALDSLGDILGAPLFDNPDVVTITLGQDEANPMSIVANASHVYWANQRCEIWRVPVPPVP